MSSSSMTHIGFRLVDWTALPGSMDRRYPMSHSDGTARRHYTLPPHPTLSSNYNFKSRITRVVGNMQFYSPCSTRSLDNPTRTMQLFPNPGDKKELRKVMMERASKSFPTLSSYEITLLLTRPLVMSMIKGTSTSSGMILTPEGRQVMAG
ncbi:MAG: hypothetical protein J3Q66DRAFT_145994 [Benniella sp.]|nr:MAG: hypothetical protein J3Q66DRAFT_145994 [Benniella sp.]